MLFGRNAAYLANMKPVLPVVSDYQAALAVLSTKLIVARYSESTCNSYRYMFREFLKYQYPNPFTSSPNGIS